MPKKPRPPHGGVFCHLITRGVAKQTIFRDAADHRAFMVRLWRVIKETGMELGAYCLMTNHLHLLARAARDLSAPMQRLLTSYAMYFNARWERTGTLFQGRFGLKRCLTDRYLKTVARYIHLNPVKAQMVQGPADYPWSSYREFLNPDGSGLTCRKTILSYFPGGLSEFREWTGDFALADLPEPGEFVPDETTDDEPEELPIEPLDSIAVRVMTEFVVPIAEFRRSKKPASSAARKAFVAQASKAGYRGTEIARFLDLSPAAVSQILSRTAENLKCEGTALTS